MLGKTEGKSEWQSEKEKSDECLLSDLFREVEGGVTPIEECFICPIVFGEVIYTCHISSVQGATPHC